MSRKRRQRRERLPGPHTAGVHHDGDEHRVNQYQPDHQTPRSGVHETALAQSFVAFDLHRVLSLVVLRAKEAGGVRPPGWGVNRDLEDG